MPNLLPVSSIVRVEINLAPAAAQSQNLDTLLVLAATSELDTVTRYGLYSDLSSVAAVFGSTGDIYKSAQAYFSQSPSPRQLMIGRWVTANTAGKLIGGPLTDATSLLTYWTDISTGMMDITIDSVPFVLYGLNFSACSTLQDVASVITSALDGGGVAFYNAASNRFEITSSISTGLGSVVSFARPGTHTPPGIDIYQALSMTGDEDGAYQANGMDAETAVAAVTHFNEHFGSSWYAIFIPGGNTSEQMDVSAFLEGVEPRHILAINTQDPDVLVNADAYVPI